MRNPASGNLHPGRLCAGAVGPSPDVAYNGAFKKGLAVMTLALALVACLAAMLFSRLVFRDYATPLGVYAFVWGAAITLLHLGVVEYHPVGAEAWSAIGLSAVFFSCGAVSGMVWALPLGSRPAAGSPGIDRRRFERALALLTVLGVVGLALQIRHLQATAVWDILWTDPVQARKLHSNVPVWGYLNILNVANFAMATYFWSEFRRFRLWHLAPVLTAMASGAITTDRTRLYYTVIWGLFVWIYAAGGLRLSARKLAGTALTAGFLLVFFVAIAAHYNRTYSDRFADYIHLPERLSFLAEPYIYFTGSLPALQAFLEDEREPGRGAYTFSPVVSLLQLADPEIEPPSLQGKLYFVPMELNTYSYLQPFVHDFGWFGVVAGPFCCGLIAGLLYGWMRRRRQFLAVYLSALAAYCCAISVFVNFFTQEATWFFAIVGALVYGYVRNRRPRPALGEANPARGIDPARG